MSQLKSLLQDAKHDSDDLGGTLSHAALKRLGRYRTRQFLIFLLVELLVVAAVAGCAWYVVTHPTNSPQAKTLAALGGLGSGGGLEIARRVWKEWSRADLLVTLLSEATEAQVKVLIDRLIEAL
jgi:hypothetical protein